eukprot:133472-Pyramimonas_sp.AAC.1
MILSGSADSGGSWRCCCGCSGAPAGCLSKGPPPDEPAPGAPAGCLSKGSPPDGPAPAALVNALGDVDPWRAP